MTSKTDARANRNIQYARAFARANRSLGQREDVERYRIVRRQLHVWGQRLQAAQAVAEVCDHSDILLAAGFVADWEGFKGIAELAAFPKDVTSLVVKRDQLAVQRAHEHHATSGRQGGGGDWCVLAVLPHFGLVRHLNGANLTDIAVAIRMRHAGEGLQTTAGVDLAWIERIDSRVGAELNRWQIDGSGLGAVGCRLPCATTRVGRAVERGFADDWNDLGIDFFLTRFRIDRKHDVLRHGFLGPHPIAAGAVDRFDDAELAGGDQHFVDEHALINVVEIERVGRQILVIPFQLAVRRIDGQRGVGIERLVGHAGVRAWRRQASNLDVPRVGLADAGEYQVLFRIV